MAKKQELNDKQRVEFARQVELFYEVNSPSWRRVMIFSFLKGIVTGLGVFLGGTILVGLLLWFLSALGHIPFLSDITESAKQTIEQSE